MKLYGSGGVAAAIVAMFLYMAASSWDWRCLVALGLFLYGYGSTVIKYNSLR